MRILNKKFKIGVDNSNTAITPIVTIGKHRNDGIPEVGNAIALSTKYFSQSTMAQDFVLLPILKNFPNTTTSLDIAKADYKISSFTFQVLNIKHDGKSLSDHLSNISNTGLLSQEVGFFLASQSNSYLGDCLKVYSGIITSIKSDDKTISITCEDYSSQVLEKEVPYANLSLEDNGKFRTEPYPMNYGYFIYSKMFLKPDDTSAEIVGVFDNPSSFYGNASNFIKGVHFFDGLSEARMSKQHSGLFARYDELMESKKGKNLIGGQQWYADPSKKAVRFGKFDGEGSKNFFGDNQFEAEFHFNKLGYTSSYATSNMVFENINISDPYDLVDASEVKKFPLITNIYAPVNEDTLDAGDNARYYWQEWANTNTYIPEGTFLHPSGYHIQKGILYNNSQIEEVENLNSYNEHYTSENEYLRIVDFSSEAYISGAMGMGADAVNSLPNINGVTTNSGQWHDTGATVGVDCLFETPPQMVDNQRIYFTLEMDMFARIQNHLYEQDLSPYTNGYQSNFIDKFPQITRWYRGNNVLPRFDYPSQMGSDQYGEHSTMQMPCMPALLYWIDDKPAGGWYAVQNIGNMNNANDFPPSHEGQYEGVHIKTGSAFAGSGQNLRSLTFSRMEEDDWNFETDEYFDPNNFIGRILGAGLGVQDNNTPYTNDGEICANLGMFVDYGASEESWMNQEKTRGAFVNHAANHSTLIYNYIPQEFFENESDLDRQAIFQHLKDSYNLINRQIFFTEKGQAPQSLSLNLWDSSMSRTIFTDPNGNYPYHLPDDAEQGELWIRSLGYYMIYVAQDFRNTDFYAYLKNGRRIDPQGSNASLVNEFPHDVDTVISNPAAVFSDILITEVGYNFSYTNETFYNHSKLMEAWEVAFNQHEISPIWYLEGDETLSYTNKHKFGFSLSDKISTKNLFKDLANECRLRPYFNGKDFTFLVIKDNYNAIGVIPDPDTDPGDDTGGDDTIVEDVYGCTNPEAFNFNEYANIDDGSCEEVVYGCMDTLADNYNENANTADSSCVYSGCTNSLADNYSDIATIDDGSCEFNGIPENEWIFGCPNPLAISLEEAQFLFEQGTIPELSGYFQENVTFGTNDDCIFPWDLDEGALVYGCTDENASNYNEGANLDDGTCEYSTVDKEIKVTFTLITTSSIPVSLHYDTDFERSWYAAKNFVGHWDAENAWGDTVYLTDADGDDVTFNDNGSFIHTGGSAWQILEGGIRYNNLSEYPPKTIIIHPYPVDLFDTDDYSEGNTYNPFTSEYNIFKSNTIGFSTDHKINPKYEQYFQSFTGADQGYGVIGAGRNFFIPNYDTNSDTPPYTTGFGLLVDSIVLEHEQRIPLTDNATNTQDHPFEIINRWYTVEATLPRPNKIIHNTGGANDWEWQYFHPQNVWFSNPAFSTYLTNDWIYNLLDLNGEEALDGLFDYSYIQENIQGAGSGGVLSTFEAGNVPVGITIQGLNYYSPLDYVPDVGEFVDVVPDLMPGSWSHQSVYAVGMTSVVSSCSYNRYTNIDEYNTVTSNHRGCPIPIAFMVVKSYDPNDTVGYAYPNQSMMPMRNPNETFYNDDELFSGGWQEENVTGSYPFGGEEFSEVGQDKRYAMNYSPSHSSHNIGTKTENWINKRTDMKIGGTYEPIGVNWRLENISNTQGSTNTSRSTPFSRNESDISRIVKKHDVIKYNITSTKTKDVVGRCRVKFNSTTEKEGFEFGTDYFYWYDIPSIKKYYEDQGVTPTDTTLQEFYNINSNESSDEDGNITTFKDCELNVESKYVNDIHSARSLAQFLLGWNMNTHTQINLTLPFEYIDLEVGDIIAIDKLLGNDLIVGGEDYSYENFITNVNNGVVNYTTRLGQVILPMFMIDKLRINSNMTITISTTQLHDWAGLKGYNSDVQLTVGSTPPPLGDGEEESELTYGCTDETALNYDPDADIDDDSCEYEDVGVLGDVNGDGNVDILDAVTMIQMVLQATPPSDAADVNGDGVVNVLDVVTLIQIILN
jgi:hypothetical protein